jgi:predicted enzyme related to lactoylglutathione lyase
MDVFDAGRMAFTADPTGALFGLWQGREHPGCERVNEPGAFTWAELRTRDIDVALVFYTAVFGYTTRSSELGHITYHELLRGENSIAGAFAMPDGMFPAEVPAHWGIAFGIDDLDRGAGRVRELGGQQLMEPVSISFGRFASFTDPVGAAFTLFEAAG